MPRLRSGRRRRLQTNFRTFSIAPALLIRTHGTMAKPISLNVTLKWPDVQDDYVVRYEGHLVGRIRLGGERYMHGTTWEWSITVPMAMPVWANGTAESRDASIKDFSVAWGRLLEATPPERLARALELERASVARQQTMAVRKIDNT
jgi:hypothetical protein